MNDNISMTPGQPGSEVRRIVPQSGLDWNMMLTDTMWGSQQISKQIKDKIRGRTVSGKGNTNRGIEKVEAWELLTFYTRDLRLANLSNLGGELEYCEYYTDLSGDMLREGFPESFATCLGRLATKLELSQSKNGFLRKRQNTLTTENLSGDVEPPKKRILNFGKSRQ